MIMIKENIKQVMYISYFAYLHICICWLPLNEPWKLLLLEPGYCICALFPLTKVKHPLHSASTDFLFTVNETPGMRHTSPQVIRLVAWHFDIKFWHLISFRASPGSLLAKQQVSPLRPSCLQALLVLSHLVPRLISCLQSPTVICTPTIWHLLTKA